MAKRKKGISRSRVCFVVFIVILVGTSLLNIMFILHTTSRATNAEKEPMEYGMRFQRLSSTSVYRTLTKSAPVKTGKLLREITVSI